MFESAKRYSEHSAYPEKPFPVIDEGSFCLLCQQELKDEAKNRLRNFWDFIQKDIAKKALEKNREFNDSYKDFIGIEANFSELNDQILEEIAETKSDLKAPLLEFKDKSEKRLASIKNAFSENDFEKIQPPGQSPFGEMNQVIKDLEAEIKRFQGMVKTEEQNLLHAELKKLESHRQFFEKKEDIIKHAKNFKMQECLKNCIASTNTTRITVKGIKFSEKVITQSLNDALSQELQAIGIEEIKINLKKSGGSGKVFHELQLSESRLQKLDTSEILSEGEQCAVSVSAFLAELKASSFRSGNCL